MSALKAFVDLIMSVFFISSIVYLINSSGHMRLFAFVVSVAWVWLIIYSIDSNSSESHERVTNIGKASVFRFGKVNDKIERLNTEIRRLDYRIRKNNERLGKRIKKLEN